MRKCCQNINIEKIIQHYEHQTLPMCCERCRLILSSLIPVQSDYDVNNFDIVIDKKHKLRLILNKTNTIEQELTDIAPTIETIYSGIILNQNLTEISHQNNDTIVIEKYQTDLRKTLIMELYNESLLITDDIKYVISHLHSNSFTKLNFQEAARVDTTKSIGRFRATRILKDYDVTEFQLRMQSTVENQLEIN